MTKTDKAFAAKNPDYYIFSSKLFADKCMTCGDKFESHLEMAKTCSPKCHLALIDSLSTRGHI